MKEKPLVNASYLLEKFPGKGGWTYASIPEIKQDKNTSFGWVRVRGHIDDYELKQYKLMPMGNGNLFLPVKKEIRKLLQKEAGDHVHICLYLDNSVYQIPKELQLCFEAEPPEVLKHFQKLGEGKQKTYVDWIYNAKTEQTKVNRILKMMDELALSTP